MEIVISRNLECRFCQQETPHTIVVQESELPTVVDEEPFCKYPTEGGFCERAVESWDDWCWQHE